MQGGTSGVNGNGGKGGYSWGQQPNYYAQANQNPQLAAQNPYMQASQGMQGAYNNTNAALAQNGAGGYSPVTASLQRGAPSISSLMGRYTNPYEKQVVQGMTNDANRQLAQMQTQNSANASAAGAFGGGRHGVTEALTNAEVNNNLQSNVADLRHQGFVTAGNFAGQDVGNILGVNAANQNAQNAMGQFNANMGMQDSQNKFNNALQGAQNLGNLAQGSFGMGSSLAGQQGEQGALSQQLLQSLMTSAQGNFSNYTNQPQSILQMRLAALGANPMNAASTSTQTGQQPNTLGGNLLGALGNMFQFAPMTLPFSSRRFKDDITPTGKQRRSISGKVVDEVTFRYKGQSVVRTGVIAEDLGADDPAVISMDGVPYAVRYDLLEEV